MTQSKFIEDVKSGKISTEEESYYDWLDRQCEMDDTSELLTEQKDIPDDDYDLPFY